MNLEIITGKSWTVNAAKRKLAPKGRFFNTSLSARPAATIKKRRRENG